MMTFVFNHYHHYYMNLKFLSLIKAVIVDFLPDSPAPIYTRLGSFMILALRGCCVSLWRNSMSPCFEALFPFRWWEKQQFSKEPTHHPQSSPVSTAGCCGPFAGNSAAWEPPLRSRSAQLGRKQGFSQKAFLCPAGLPVFLLWEIKRPGPAAPKEGSVVY